MESFFRLMQEHEVSEDHGHKCKICEAPVDPEQVYCMSCAVDLAAADAYNEDHGNMWEGL